MMKKKTHTDSVAMHNILIGIFQQREVVTIYELIKAPNGKSYVAIPDYQFK